MQKRISDLELEGAGVDVEPPEGRGHLRGDHFVKAFGVVDEGVRLVITVSQVLVVILTPTRLCSPVLSDF